jgi:MurNAc alpha-1-phosphate uridylyltransferase
MTEPMTEPARFPDVMLLAAGLGSRLKPFTDTAPKPLLPVAGIALIDRVIAAARAEGARRFVVNAFAHADQMLAHFAGHPHFTVLRENTLMGIGGGIRNALPSLAGDRVLVMNTDAFWRAGADAPLARLIARHAASGAAATLLCVPPLLATGFGRSHDFCLDPRGRITPDSGAPVIHAGVALLERALFADTPEGPFPLSLVLDRARAEDRLFGAPLMAPWFHVGDSAGLAAAEQRLAG